MNLPIFFTKHHIKMCRPWKIGLTSVFGFLSCSWIPIEILSHFFTPIRQITHDNWIVFLIVIFIAILYGLRKSYTECKKQLLVVEQIEKTDISLEIKVGNIFNTEEDLIIATDTSFNTSKINPDSLLAQLCSKYYDNKQHFDNDLQKALDGNSQFLDANDSKKIYEIGTVANINVKNKEIYFLAIDTLGSRGGATASLEDIRHSLTKLWEYIGEKTNTGHLAIPIIGTKSAGIQIRREVMIREIIKSFVDSVYSEKKFCDKLTIVIYEEDYKNRNIDLQELRNYLHIYATQIKWEEPTSKDSTGVSVSSFQKKNVKSPQ